MREFAFFDLKQCFCGEGVIADRTSYTKVTNTMFDDELANLMDRACFDLLYLIYGQISMSGKTAGPFSHKHHLAISIILRYLDIFKMMFHTIYLNKQVYGWCLWQK